jgi:innexin
MYQLFDAVKKLIKIQKTCIDNLVFWLHYKFTFILFLTSSILITAKQFFGDPISCMVDEIEKDVINNYCWIRATYTIPRLLDGEVGRDVAQPGVGSNPRDGWRSEDVKYHSYYQWVCFMLFLQGELEVWGRILMVELA